MYVTTFCEETTWLRSVAALYPGLWPITDRMLKIQSDKIHVYVGEDDDWTPAKHALALKERLPSLRVTIYPGVKHSYCKPGCGPFYEEVVNTSDMPFPIPVAMSEFASRSGEYLRILESDVGVRLGVHAEYNHDATMATINDFLD